MITITQLRRADKSQLKEVNKLSPQLSASGGTTSFREFSIMVKDPSYAFFVAKDGARIIGMAQLVMMHTPAQVRGRVESVVVDAAYRGKGIGTRLMQAVLLAAKKKKIHSLSLTSDPARKEANKLYRELGFELHKTNAYKMKF